MELGVGKHPPEGGRVELVSKEMEEAWAKSVLEMEV